MDKHASRYRQVDSLTDRYIAVYMYSQIDMKGRKEEGRKEESKEEREKERKGNVAGLEEVQQTYPISWLNLFYRANKHYNSSSSTRHHLASSTYSDTNHRFWALINKKEKISTPVRNKMKDRSLTTKKQPIPGFPQVVQEEKARK